MKTIGDFMGVLATTKHSTAAVSIKRWQKKIPKEEWDACMAQELLPPKIIVIREQMSEFYAERLQAISGEDYYNETLLEHVEFIREFDDLAAKEGFIITAPRRCISMSEALLARQQADAKQVEPNPATT